MTAHYRLLPIIASAFVAGCALGVAALAAWAWFETEGRNR